MKWIGILILTFGSGLGQPATAPTFEVASIRPHAFPKGAFGFGSGGVQNKGNRITAIQATIQGLFMYAYGVKDYQIVGATHEAPWSDFYDVAATTGEDAPAEDRVRQMMQGLLADRFQLKLHHETKDLAVYNLIVGKNGPKLKKSPAGAKPGGALTQGSVTRIQFSNRPISDLVRQLNLSNIDRPVLDKTGLTGGYDFTLEFSRGTADSTSASIFTAVQEQLGLKLDPAREPTDVLVIDHVESRPSAN